MSPEGAERRRSGGTQDSEAVGVDVDDVGVGHPCIDAERVCPS
jgi:hypothetical protein